MKRAGAAETTDRPRDKGSLDRAVIVATALMLLDEVGIDGLSTRRLAAELGIKSASLYWHFKDKAELFPTRDTANKAVMNCSVWYESFCEVQEIK
jgi:AcrR family transcriptional regulator